MYNVLIIVKARWSWQGEYPKIIFKKKTHERMQDNHQYSEIGRSGKKSAGYLK